MLKGLFNLQVTLSMYRITTGLRIDDQQFVKSIPSFFPLVFLF